MDNQNNYNMSDINKPISTWGYVGYSLLFSIPLVGFILMIVFSFSNGNIHLKNFARSKLILAGIAFVIGLFFSLALLIFGSLITSSVRNDINDRWNTIERGNGYYYYYD